MGTTVIYACVFSPSSQTFHIPHGRLVCCAISTTQFVALWLASHKATYRLLLFPLDFVPEVFVDREPAMGFAKVGY